MPFVLRPASVRACRDLAYGTAGRHNRLDLYHHRSRPRDAPVLIHFHGGGFSGGRKSVESRALLFRLASRGWVTISANYRLRPEAGLHDHLIDVKKVLAWVAEHGPEYGADPSKRFVSGGSAGGTLACLAALTQNQASYQPGFEDADTSVTGAISLSGWYGGYYEMGGPESEYGAPVTKPPVHHPSSSPTVATTRWPPSRPQGGSSGTPGSPHPTRSSPSSCPTASTRSTSSTRFATRQSSTGSSTSPRGHDPTTLVDELGSVGEPGVDVAQLLQRARAWRCWDPTRSDCRSLGSASVS
jgi:hypothetical protein